MVEIQSIEGGVKFVFQDNTFYLQNGTIQYPLNALAMIIDESNAVTFRLPNNDIALSVKLSELGKTKAEMEALYAEAFVGDSGMAPEDVEELIDERVTPIEEELDALDGVVTAHTGNSEIHVTAADKQNWNAKASQASVDALQATVTAHTADTTIHVTAQEKATWNAKASQADIENLQQQIDTKEETISAALNDLNDGLDTLEATVTAHTADTTIHVTAQEKTTWNAKADASDIADIEAELATKADQADLDALEATVTAHTADTQIHVTAQEKQTWNAKADATDVESQFEVAAIAMTKLDEEKADKEDTYTKAEVDAAIASGSHTYTAGRGIDITNDVVSFNLAISAGTGAESVVQGGNCRASGNTAHAEGGQTHADGATSHSEGQFTTASGTSSHAEGYGSQALGEYSHAEGLSTITYNQGEHAQGHWNVSHSASTTFGDSGNTLFSIGNGTATNARHNAVEVRQNGDIYIVKDGQDVKLQDQLGGGSITIDPALNSGSTNAVANSAITEAIDNLQGQIDVKEEVVATALNDLNDGLDTLQAQLQSLEQAIAAQLGGLSFVKISQSDYDALTVKDANTVYIISD